MPSHPESFWNIGLASARTTVTLEDIRASGEAIRNQREPDPCSIGRHVVSPRALTRPGLYHCVDCMRPLEIPYPLSEDC